jgi:hypothetical protein
MKFEPTIEIQQLQSLHHQRPVTDKMFNRTHRYIVQGLQENSLLKKGRRGSVGKTTLFRLAFFFSVLPRSIVF